MKTYRLKKWYPSLPKWMKVGYEIHRYDDLNPFDVLLHKGFISQDELECEEYWEDITPAKCTCTYPKLQKETRECGECKNYIDKEKHIILTERYRLVDEFVGFDVFVSKNSFLNDEDVKFLIKQWENFKDKQDA